jgi:oleandomycin transport system ATP-binding protein
MPRAEARARAVELLEAFSLTDAGGRAAKTYSGGMRRRLDLAASLVGRPSVLFLDEPTTGLDPRARNEVWDMVRRLLATGVTVLLTTQYLEEADQLADEIAVVDHGRVIATGTPDELKNKIAAQTLQVRPADPAAVQRVAAIVAEVVRSTPEIENTTVSAVVNDPAVLPEVVRRLDDAGVLIAELALRSASLDEVFLALTGHPAEDQNAEDENADDGNADDGKADDGKAGDEDGKDGDVSRAKRKTARKAKDDVLAGAPGDGADKKGTQR